MRRRRFLRAAGTATAVGATGCLGGDNDGNTTDGNETSDEGPSDNVKVTAGPEGAWRFEPEEVEVTVEGTVEWYFASAGHNVTSHPDADPKCENPEGAEPFKSYEGDNHARAVNEQGTTFEHTFETPGEYTYVCVPHATQMVGYVTVVDV
jgi:plastocyanin